MTEAKKEDTRRRMKPPPFLHRPELYAGGNERRLNNTGISAGNRFEPPTSQLSFISCVPSIRELQSRHFEISSNTIRHKHKRRNFTDLNHHPSESFKSSDDEISSDTSNHRHHPT
ncbi:unnamed protein product [Brassica oleracea var. botrytis]|uniref:(rape) hypothetical protein n=1 Tax=Brassica napus TaxID=3708 RepID=A0A816KL56_BRANA|nr:unnamed protein product [Brassica napus]